MKLPISSPSFGEVNDVWSLTPIPQISLNMHTYRITKLKLYCINFLSSRSTAVITVTLFQFCEEHTIYVQMLSTLNLSATTPKFRTTAMFVIADLEIIFHI